MAHKQKNKNNGKKKAGHHEMTKLNLSHGL